MISHRTAKMLRNFVEKHGPRWGENNLDFERSQDHCSHKKAGIIHPASRGVAAHTAGLFRSVRGAKDGFPPWGLPKLRIFTFPPPWGLPKLGNFHFSPPWGLPKLGNFHFSPRGAPQAREFSLFPPVGAHQAREFSLFPPVGLPKLGNFHFSPKLWNFHFSLPWRLSKLRNFK